MYGWTFGQISEMTFAQQGAALGGKGHLKFNSMAEYQQWRTENVNGLYGDTV